jgi:pimeloyl-ACP methyl ester carboxylesterase
MQRERRKIMSKVISKDGTTIEFERTGGGPVLILVDGALCSRAFGPMPKLAPLLAKHFTVFVYDRRGRGGSGDVKPYSTKREVEDIEALIKEAGGSAYLLGLSSGGALALEAAAAGLNVGGVAIYEPPFMVDDDGYHARANHEAQLHQLIVQDQRSSAVKYFMRKMIGIPGIFVLVTQLMPGVWSKLKAVAHTLPYDAAIMGDWSIPKQRFGSITTRVLAMDGEKTDRRLRRAVEEVVKVLPRVQRRTLKGQTHNVNPDVLTPAVVEFFAVGAQP